MSGFLHPTTPHYANPVIMNDYQYPPTPNVNRATTYPYASLRNANDYSYACEATLAGSSSTDLYPPTPNVNRATTYAYSATSYAYESPRNVNVNTCASRSIPKPTPSTRRSFTYNARPLDPTPVPIYSTNPPSSTPNDLFTWEPLDLVRIRSPLVPQSSAISHPPRSSDAQPWAWVDGLSSRREVEESLGISLDGVSTPNLEGPGKIYCYQIEESSDYPSTGYTGYFKVGRTCNVAARKAQWRRQCRSQQHKWYPSVDVKHCRLTGETYEQRVVSLLTARIERLIHLKLHQICVNWPRKTCTDCSRKHQEIFELELVEGDEMQTVSQQIFPLIGKIESLLCKCVRIME
ncbi:hypothetical protein PQX77_003650 [Marasmius sp. AFHP31]|nr:hypothetical protein PQX77_003650 [Marasmius sp. AFHP31]